MKIALNITVEVDADGWCREYGIERRQVRADVRRYVETALADAPVPMVTVRVPRRLPDFVPDPAVTTPAAEPAHDRARPGDATTGTPATPGGRETGEPTPGGPHTHKPAEPAPPASPTVELRPAIPATPVRIRSHRPPGRPGRIVPALLAAAVAAVITVAAGTATADHEPGHGPRPLPAPATATRRPGGRAGTRPAYPRPPDNRPGSRPYFVEIRPRHIDGADPHTRWRAEAAARPGTAVYDPRRWPRDAGDRPPDDRPPPRPKQPPPPDPRNPDRPPRPRAAAEPPPPGGRRTSWAWNAAALVALAAVIVLCLASIRGPGW